MRVVRVLPAALGLAACLQSPPGSEPRDAAAPADAAAPDGPPVGPCITLDDEFDTPELDPLVWRTTPDPGGTIVSGGGRLVLDADPDDRFTYLSALTIESRPLDDLWVTADLQVFVEGMGDAALVVSGPTGYIGVYTDSGLLGVARDLEADFEFLCGDSCPPYDAVEHRLWRIREADGFLQFETSRDGSLYNELITALPAPAGDHVIILWAEAGAGNRVISTIDHVFTACGG